ncbi:MAG: SdpI family protein [Pseudomonadota bacterium]
MDLYDKSLVTVIGVSLVLVALAIPLVLRRVPPNPVYGFRTRATQADAALWREANAYFGRLLIAATAIACAFAITVRFTLPLAPGLVVPLTVACFTLPGLFAALATLRFVRQHPGAGR